MAVLNICSCSECDCEYIFTDNGLGLGKETFAKYHSRITQDIAAGKYGEELRRNMVCPESVYLEWANEYAFCPRCNRMHFGGRIAVYLHKEGKPANLVYDDWNCSYYLSGFCAKEDYREILLLPMPCRRCQGEEQYFSSYEEMSCPECGSPMTNGALLPRDRSRQCPTPCAQEEPEDPDFNWDDFDVEDDASEETYSPPPESGFFFGETSFWSRVAAMSGPSEEPFFPSVEVTCSSDGERGEVREYGPDGRLIEATHILFKAIPEDSDDDFPLGPMREFCNFRFDEEEADLE